MILYSILINWILLSLKELNNIFYRQNINYQLNAFGNIIDVRLPQLNKLIAKFNNLINLKYEEYFE